MNEAKTMEMEAKKRLVIYTALTRGYDELQQPEMVLSDIDYICFSNDIVEQHIGVWTVKPIPYKTNDPIRLVRYAKLHPEVLVPNYEASLWLDSNIKATSEIQNRACECLASEIPLATLPHSIRHYVLDEAIICLRVGVGKPREIVRQMRFLISEHFPDTLGLKETCIFYRSNRDSRISLFDKVWWDVLDKHSTRDQLGCDYALWKTGVPFTAFSDPSILSRCKRQHVATSKRLSPFKQCIRRFYLMQALYLYMKQRLRTTLCP